MPPEVDISEVPNRPGNYERCRLIGPVTYEGHTAIKREIDTLREAMQAFQFADAFIPVDLPTTRMGDQNILESYPSTEAYLYAVADAMREEYRMGVT